MLESSKSEHLDYLYRAKTQADSNKRSSQRQRESKLNDEETSRGSEARSTYGRNIFSKVRDLKTQNSKDDE
jgi:hypothetical protein